MFLFTKMRSNLVSSESKFISKIAGLLKNIESHKAYDKIKSYKCVFSSFV